MKTSILNAGICFFLLMFVHPMLKAQTVEDSDGNIYKTITLGKQTWMQENLKVTHYLNRDPIGTTESKSMKICAETEPQYYWTVNDSSKINPSPYKLYTWYVVSDKRGLCPAGWHVPDNSDWINLRKFLGADSLSRPKSEENDSAYWQRILTGRPDQSGFSSIPNMRRNCAGAWMLAGPACCWWSSSQGDQRSRYWGIELNFGDPLKSYFEELNGFPVRCVKDEEK